MSDLHKLTGAYALDALDELERARFDQHLAMCEDCRAEVAELRETAAFLAEAVATPPPASLRTAVLAGISQVRPMPPEVPVAAPTSISSARAQRRRPVWTTFLVAAALMLVAGVGIATWSPWASDEVPQLTAAEQVLQAPDAERVVLDLGETGHAEVIRSKELHKAVIRTEDMAAAPSGQVYQLWLQQRGDMVPAGLMEGGSQEIILEGDAATASAAGVTIEPAGGSTTPNLPAVALFDFSEAT